jgi:sugar lactone lactonase YvrE
MKTRTRVLLDGLRFPECPRWDGKRLWLSDMHAGRVLAVDLEGRAETVLEVPGEPGGLGWLPDGRLLVVSMHDRRLLRHDGDRLETVADLSPFATFHCNDLVVDAAGRAYVGNFGFDLHARATVTPANLILVHPDGRVEVAAEELLFPNGMVITPDARTLVVGESFAGRLTAFDVGPDGRLSNRRVWARTPGAVPDGICLDAEGAIWVASPVSNEVLRVREGGEVAERIGLDRLGIACMLGGPERRTLFVCTSKYLDPSETDARQGRIEMAEVAVPGAGRP